jgi:DNA-binding transcriptional LysR family regulator
MDKFGAMGAFVKVVASGSYAEAGRQLGLTRSAVSKGVIELEDDLQVRLLNRTTRRVAPTEAGLAYYEQCLAILAQVDETEQQVSRLHDEPKGVLKINGPLTFGTRYLGKMAAEFMSPYRDLRVELSLTDRYVDPIEEGFDITLRIGALKDSSLIARRIATTRMRIVASPNYLKTYGTPRVPSDLAAHRCLTYAHTTMMQKWWLLEGGKVSAKAVGCAMASNNGDVLRDASVSGVGIALLPEFIVGPDVAAGNLRPIMNQHVPPDLEIHALYAPNRYLAAKTRLFIDHLVQKFGKKPDWSGLAKANL